MLHLEPIRPDTARIQCPACGGLFCVRFAPPDPGTVDSAYPRQSQGLAGCRPLEGASSQPIQSTPETTGSRDAPAYPHSDEPRIEVRGRRRNPVCSHWIPDRASLARNDEALKSLLPETSNPASPPAEPGVYPLEAQDSSPPAENRGGRPGWNNGESLRSTGDECPDLKEAPPSLRREPDSSLEIQAAPVRHSLQESRPKHLLFWTLAPACCLLLALTGILVSDAARPGRDAPGFRPLQADLGKEESFSSSVSSQPKRSADPRALHQEMSLEAAAPTLSAENPVAEAFWAPAASDTKDACTVLLQSQAAWLDRAGEDACEIYALWITWLILETSPASVCNLAPTFSLATGALQDNTLCGPGHAFLAAYYLANGLLERSQSFLDEALGRTPNDPWVKLVEASFYAEAYYDDRKAIRILEELNHRHPSFPLARYLLGKAYIREEDYKQANENFVALNEDVKGQAAFWRIRRALLSLEQAAHESVAKAEGLLALSRSFAALKDDPMATHLYRRVLEEMPGRLPKQDRMAACCELARIYQAKGDHGGAYESYRKALEIDPGYQTARDGIRELLPRNQANPS